MMNPYNSFSTSAIDDLYNKYRDALSKLEFANKESQRSIEKLKKIISDNEQKIQEHKIRLETLSEVRLNSFRPISLSHNLSEDLCAFSKQSISSLEKALSSIALKPLTSSDLWPQDIGDPVLNLL